MEKKSFANVDEYISNYDVSRQEILKNVRNIILKNAPDATEVISYQMPAYKFHGALVYFAIYEKHLGLYPTGSSLVFFDEDLKPYKRSKGAVQFQLKEVIPYELIERIVKYRVKENYQKSFLKKK